MSTSNALALRWQSLLIDHLIEFRPTNQTSIVAVAAVMVKHADPDGSHVYPAQQTMAREAGLSRSTVFDVTQFLEEAKWVSLVRFRAHGQKEYRLTIPQMSDEWTSSGSDVQPDAGQMSDEWTQPPTSEIKNARDDDTEYEDWVQTRTQAKGGGPGLAAKIRSEDRRLFELEREHQLAEQRLEECSRCDRAGWILDDDEVPIEPTIRCGHGVA